MAVSHVTSTLAICDRLSELNSALAAFEEMNTAWIQQAMDVGPSGDIKSHASGSSYIFKMLVQSYQDVGDQVNFLRKQFPCSEVSIDE